MGIGLLEILLERLLLCLIGLILVIVELTVYLSSSSDIAISVTHKLSVGGDLI